MNKSMYLLVILAFTVSCASEPKNTADSKASEIEPSELIEDTEPVVSYPIKITQRNIKQTYEGSEKVYHAYDSIEITQLSDSSYFFQYFREGRPNPKAIDTLFLHEPVTQIDDTSQQRKHELLLTYNPFAGPGNKEILYEIEMDGKVYKVIEKNSSCCRIWEPRGHVHQGSKSYFSLDFGMLGEFQITESSTSKTLFHADWDQKLVDSLIQKLPLRFDKLLQMSPLIQSN